MKTKNDKRIPRLQFKVMEAVHLGYDFIYVRCRDTQEIQKVYDFGIAPTFTRHEQTSCKNVYRFYIKPDAIRFYKTIVIPSYPTGWFAYEPEFKQGSSSVRCK